MYREIVFGESTRADRRDIPTSDVPYGRTKLGSFKTGFCTMTGEVESANRNTTGSMTSAGENTTGVRSKAGENTRPIR